VKGKIKKDRMAYVRQWQWRKKQHRENLRGKSEVDRQGVPKLWYNAIFSENHADFGEIKNTIFANRRKGL